VKGHPAEEPYTLRTSPTVRRALAETMPEAVAAAAYEFMTGPLLREPYRVGKIIYRVDDKARMVTVVDIGHRRDVYRS
jgi:mRNA interferase RelE/StbE